MAPHPRPCPRARRGSCRRRAKRSPCITSTANRTFIWRATWRDSRCSSLQWVTRDCCSASPDTPRPQARRSKVRETGPTHRGFAVLIRRSYAVPESHLEHSARMSSVPARIVDFGWTGRRSMRPRYIFIPILLCLLFPATGAAQQKPSSQSSTPAVNADAATLADFKQRLTKYIELQKDVARRFAAAQGDVGSGEDHAAKDVLAAKLRRLARTQSRATSSRRRFARCSGA